MKKFLFCIILFLYLSSNVFAEDWVLAAKRFEFTQSKKRDISEEELSALMPQLILEQISEGLIRKTSGREMMNRSLESYLVERQSLFLQLSKEYKKRDSLVLTTSSKKKLEKAIKKQQAVIKEIEDKIEENLNNTEQIKTEYKDRYEKPEENVAESDFMLFFNPLTNLFVKKKEELLPETQEEKILLYKNDSTELYVPGDSLKNKGPESRAFEKEMTSAKINGLIDGTITVYGEYFSITCSLYLYPGRERLGTVTEVGRIRNTNQVAANIASYFCPLITNHKPVEVFFEITPAEILEKSHVTVDGIYYEKVPEKLNLDSGKHSVKVECQGYFSRNITYEFTGWDKFIIQADMVEEKKYEFSIAPKKADKGKIYADGKFAGDIFEQNYYGKFTAGNEAVIGNFVSDRKNEDGDNESFFYYVPEKLTKNDSFLVANGKARDHEAYIDKRRIWTYRAYSLLVLSMPFTLYYTGQLNAAIGAYNNGSKNDLDEVNRLQKKRDISFGITIACTSLFVVELVRYLFAANSVLPANAHKASEREIKKLEKRAAQSVKAVETETENAENKAAESIEGSDSDQNSPPAESENKTEEIDTETNATGEIK